ncbi:GxxExxY protein [Sphingomonas mali]
MLESVYEACLFQSLATRGLIVERQKVVPNPI